VRDNIEVVVILLHSMFGLRRVEHSAADRIRAAGHRVVMPDLFDGATVAGNVEAAFSLMQNIGWSTIVGRARSALTEVPDEAALDGFSMGVGVLGELWPERITAAAVFCLHAPVTVPPGIPARTPVQLHVAEGDHRFAPADRIAAFTDSAERAGALASVHRYPGAGHFFTDPALPDYDATAAESTWTRALDMLHAMP
jgi:dienelactone hydrolase